MNGGAVASVMLMMVAVGNAYITGNGYNIVTKHSSQYFDNGVGTGGNSIESYHPSGIGSGYSEAGIIGYQSAQAYPENGYDYSDHYAYPKYKYNYGVQDAHTGDHKSQWEIRDGDVVKGGYTLYDADGTKRVVEYTADKHHGFNAVVKKIGHASHPQVYKTEHGISGGGYDEAEGYSYSNINQHL
ncbi:cuticle protein 7-like [Anopheles nili]|uniref:cuticle protein 7-like n=1 Tax=Anopheles nili TaxID=185578 RepID=UPI00237AA46E|nr:cuticle protein 7-like [Anopheles nili]